MEIKELVSYYINETSHMLEVTFKTLTDSEDEIRTDQIVLDEIETFGYNILNNINENFFVFDNIGAKPDNKIIGWDSIGCTIFCGKKDIEKIYWCGSILNHTDNNVNKYFTSTIIQVAAGVLSGLSYIMEKSNKKKGLMMSCDLDTVYILKKAMPLLVQFFITEIDKRKFNNDLYLKVKK